MVERLNLKTGEWITLKPCAFCGMEMEATNEGNGKTWYKHPRHEEPDTCILEGYRFYAPAVWNKQPVIERLERQIAWLLKRVDK